MMERLTEVSIRIYTPKCLLYKRFRGEVKIIDIRRNNDYIAHLISFPADQLERIREFIWYEGGILEDLINKGEELVGWYMSGGCEVCRPLAHGGSFLVKGRLHKDGSMDLLFVVPSRRVLGDLLSYYDKNNIKYVINRITQFKSRKVLTGHQERILYVAYKMGFFDHPRRISLTELSRVIGVKPSTLSEILRRGIRRLVESHFK